MSEKLLQTPTQGIPKTVDEIVNFILSLQEKGMIKIYSAEQRHLESKIKLLPAKNIADKQPYIAVSTDSEKHKYHLFKDVKSTEPVDGNSYGSINSAVIEKLSPDLPAQKILIAYTGKLMLPAGSIIVRVKLSYTELWKKNKDFDYKASSIGEMNVEYVPLGLKHIDDFLECVCRFARGEKLNH